MMIPDGFHSVSPYIFSSNSRKLIEFLKSSFGAKEVLITEDDQGRVSNAIVRIGDSSFMISDGGGKVSPMPASFMLYVENADATVKLALQNGATQEMPVADQPYGDRQGGIKDPTGNIWWVSQRLVTGPYT